MEFNYQQQPNLASILQTLQAYAPSHQQAPQPPYQSYIPQAANNPQPPPPQPLDLEEGEYDPSTYDPTLPLITTPHPQTVHPNPPETHIWNPPQTTQPQQLSTSQTPPAPHPPPKPASPPPKKPHQPPTYHPSTITTWPPALRHITSQTTTSPTFLPRIRHLITTQHAHERQWWAGRVELATRLAGREAGRKKLDSVLNSLGGRVVSSSSSSSSCSSNQEISSAQETEREMELYDRKVYRACGEMVAAMGKELRRLEVPFFCTVEGLVGGEGEGEGKRKGRVSEREMGELRGRMMVLLEDLCGGE